MHIEQKTFRATSLQLLAGLQRNFMGTFNTKRRWAYRRLVQVRLFNSELWPLISYAICIKSKNRFQSSSLHLLAGIQQNFMGIINIKRKCAYRRLVPVRPFNSELWPLISNVVWIWSKNRFRSSSLRLLAGIQQNFMGTFNTKRRCAYRWLFPVKHFNPELWPLISYAVCIWSKIVSALLFCNYWLEFNETLWESSIPRGDAHIVALFR
jgi:hypothetical protein